MSTDDRTALLAEIETRAADMVASLEKLPEGPPRSIALSQIGEALRLAGIALPELPPDAEQQQEADGG